MSGLLHETLTEVVDLLTENHVPFAVIGGIAASLRGEARFTADVDVVIQADVQRSLRLLDVLESTPFRPLFAGVAEIVETAFLLPMRHRRTGIKVDLSLGLTQFEQQAIARATPLPMAGRSIPIATAEDLILMKLLAARPRDIDDVRGIVLRAGETLDWSYLLRTGKDLQDAVDQDLVPQLRQLQRLD